MSDKVYLLQFNATTITPIIKYLHLNDWGKNKAEIELANNLSIKDFAFFEVKNAKLAMGTSGQVQGLIHLKLFLKNMTPKIKKIKLGNGYEASNYGKREVLFKVNTYLGFFLCKNNLWEFSPGYQKYLSVEDKEIVRERLVVLNGKRST